jgi:hypothetical protein
MKRCQVFGPEDLDLMSKVFLRASREIPMTQFCEKQMTVLAKAIIITFRAKATEAALMAAATHLVALRYLNEDTPRQARNNRLKSDVTSTAERSVHNAMKGLS